MSYASQAGRARTSASRPQAHAICDRCGFRYNFVDLQWQYEWRGAALLNIKILVCKDCLDTPQENVRSIIVPPDPLPIVNARVQDFDAAANDYFALLQGGSTDPATGLPVSSPNTIVTDAGIALARQSIGRPTGRQIIGQAPLVAGLTWGAALTPISLSSNGSKTVSMTFGVTPKGLATGSQVGVMGSGDRLADGIFTVTQVTAMLFTYTAATPIAANGLLLPTTVVRTANVGVPRSAAAVPEVAELFATAAPTPVPPTYGQFLLTDSGQQITTDAGVDIETSATIVSQNLTTDSGVPIETDSGVIIQPST
jgi:hypothetical protein